VLRAFVAAAATRRVVGVAARLLRRRLVARAGGAAVAGRPAVRFVEALILLVRRLLRRGHGRATRLLLHHTTERPRTRLMMSERMASTSKMWIHAPSCDEVATPSTQRNRSRMVRAQSMRRTSV